MRIDFVHPDPQPVADPVNLFRRFPDQTVVALVQYIEVIPNRLDGNKALHEMVQQLDKKAIAFDSNDKSVVFVAQAVGHELGHDPAHDCPLRHNRLSFSFRRANSNFREAAIESLRPATGSLTVDGHFQKPVHD
jgi:hypothetical protein